MLTIYPISIAFKSDFLIPLRALVEGKGKLCADAFYDNNLISKHMFKAGYLQIIKPNNSRNRKYHRRKARKIWNNLKDRLRTISVETTITRIEIRIIAYLIRICIRNTIFL